MDVLGRTRKGDADGGLLEWVVRGLRRVFEKPQLAMGVMVEDVVLALIKARAEDKDGAFAVRRSRGL